MFGEIPSRIRSSRFTKDVVMSLENYIVNPIKNYIHGFGSFFCTSLLTIPSEVEFSACMYVEG